MAVAVSYFKGVVFVAALGVTALAGSFTILVPGLLLLPISMKAYRRYNDFVLELWLSFVTGLVELIFGIKVRISGDLEQLSSTSPTLIIMNHRTRFDWLFFWCFLLRQGKLGYLKIVLKNALKSIPAIGWSMQQANYIFLHRKWSQDEAYMKRALCYLTDNHYPLQLLLFPEGTDLSPGNRKRDKDYAEKNGLCLYEYVLHPRSLGFVSCYEEMSRTQPVAVCDLTVGYIGSIAQNESDILAGNWPTEIHFHSKLVPSDQLPVKEKLVEWLKNCWDNKEQMLCEFHRNKSFPGPKLKDNVTIWYKMAGYILFWLVLVMVFFYFILAVPYVWLYAITVIVVNVIADKMYGGWDNIVLCIHDRNKNI